jgi:S1-C subfamily serine protease/ubiquitin-protein ligase
LPLRTRRLLADAEQMQRAFGQSSLIRIQATVGDPPELYRLEYRVRGLARGADGQPVPRDSHLVEIQLTSEYPRVSPKCRVLTPIFHPNIDATTICVGDHWAAGERLVDLVVRIGEMIMFQAYNIKSPLDGEAAMWADLNHHRLPLDRRDLLAGGAHGLPEPGAAPASAAKHTGISVERRRPALLPPAASSVPLPARAPAPARKQPQQPAKTGRQPTGRRRYGLLVALAAAVLLAGGGALGLLVYRAPNEGRPRAQPYEGLSRAQLAKRAKAATALVDVKGRGGSGSAFCIHPSGLFVSTAHAVQGEFTLVLSPGQKAEKSYPARVLRTDNDQDLALLRVDGARDLHALPLGPDAKLEELMEVWAFGYPPGPAPAQGGRDSPAFSATEGSIRSLPLKDGRPPRIQLNAALEAGDSGGPLLDQHGQVIGVVAGVQSGGTSLAIPVSGVAAFVSRPDVQFEPPPLGPAELHRPVRFEARVTPVFPPAAPLAVDLVLTPIKGREQAHRMQADGDTYRVTAVPVPPPPGRFTLPLRARFDDGALEGTAADRAFKVGNREVKLSEVRGIRQGATPQVLLHDGKRLKGKLTGLEAVPMRLGKQTLSVSLAGAAEVKCPPETDQVSCTLLVQQGGKEVFRQSRSLTPLGLLKNPGFEDGLEGWSPNFDANTRRVIEFDTDVAREGWQALRVTATEPFSTNIYQLVTLKPGQWYRFSGWVRTRGLDPRGASQYGRFEIQPGEGGSTIATGTDNGGDTEWSEVQITFQAPAGGLTRIVVIFIWGGQGTGTAWFDDLKLVEVSEPAP